MLLDTLLSDRGFSLSSVPQRMSFYSSEIKRMDLGSNDESFLQKIEPYPTLKSRKKVCGESMWRKYYQLRISSPFECWFHPRLMYQYLADRVRWLKRRSHIHLLFIKNWTHNYFHTKKERKRISLTRTSPPRSTAWTQSALWDTLSSSSHKSMRQSSLLSDSLYYLT